MELAFNRTCVNVMPVSSQVPLTAITATQFATQNAYKVIALHRKLVSVIQDMSSRMAAEQSVCPYVTFVKVKIAQDRVIARVGTVTKNRKCTTVSYNKIV